MAAESFIGINAMEVNELTVALNQAGRVAAKAATVGLPLAAKAVQDQLRAEARNAQGRARGSELQQLARSLISKRGGRARSVGGGRTRIPWFPSSITYEVFGFKAFIGPETTRRQGYLGNILYFGTSRHGPVLPGMEGALHHGGQVLEVLVAEKVAQGFSRDS